MNHQEMSSAEKIKTFLAATAFAVAGASSRRHKYGNKVLRCYLQHHKTVYPLNPIEKSIEGLTCLKNVSELPHEVTSLSIITPPAVTERIVEQSIATGIKNIWMQPGAESEAAINLCLQNNINLIAQGPCILVVLGFIERS